MSEPGPASKINHLTKRIVFIGDEQVGKSTIITAFQESNPSCCLPTEKQNNLANGISNILSPSSSTKRSKDSEDEDDEEISVVDPVLAAELEAKIINATMRHEDCVYQIAMLEADSDIKVMKKQRSAVYVNADAVVVMFSIDSMKSFRNVSKKWRPHLKKFLRDKMCPVILVGNKLDLRTPRAEDEDSEDDNDEMDSVSMRAGKKLGNKLRAVEYFECSALNKEGIFEIFTKAATHVSKVKPLGCMIV